MKRISKNFIFKPYYRIKEIKGINYLYRIERKRVKGELTRKDIFIGSEENLKGWVAELKRLMGKREQTA